MSDEAVRRLWIGIDVGACESLSDCGLEAEPFRCGYAIVFVEVGGERLRLCEGHALEEMHRRIRTNRG